jgi:hypothetical protein
MDLITEWLVSGFYHAGRAIGFLFITIVRTLILRP